MLDEYQKFVASRVNPDLGETEQDVVIALGLAGEAGEYADHIKKYFGQGHPLDRDKLIEELGDILFYVAWGATRNGISLLGLLYANTTKLTRRYPDGFTVKASLDRVDCE